MGTRRKGRELAVQALYQIDLVGGGPDSLRLFFERAEAGQRARDFAADLVAGVEERRAHIDEMIAAAAEHWRIERLSTVDLNVLRVATWELLQGAVPTSVVLDEAIEIARRFGTTESATFVNGVLDQIATRLGVKVPPSDRSAHDDG
jgi:N utilization substance protein B